LVVFAVRPAHKNKNKNHVSLSKMVGFFSTTAAVVLLKDEFEFLTDVIPSQRNN
jgi:hypothetical protein